MNKIYEKGEYSVNGNAITNCNRACFARLASRGLQEGVFIFLRSRRSKKSCWGFHKSLLGPIFEDRRLRIETKINCSDQCGKVNTIFPPAAPLSFDTSSRYPRRQLISSCLLLHDPTDQSFYLPTIITLTEPSNGSVASSLRTCEYIRSPPHSISSCPLSFSRPYPSSYGP